jgi:UPF0716 protein FxsA
MTVLGRLALLFVVVPLVELVLLVQLGQVVGLWPTLALVIFTGVTGAALARLEGLRVLYRFQAELASGRLPGQALLDGISVLVGGAFLLTPGILTDLAGFALLLPTTRRWIQRRVRRRLERGLKQGTIRVVKMGPGGLGWFGDAGASERARGEEGGGRESERPLDPSKGIVVEPGDGSESKEE